MCRTPFRVQCTTCTQQTPKTQMRNCNVQPTQVVIIRGVIPLKCIVEDVPPLTYCLFKVYRQNLVETLSLLRQTITIITRRNMLT